MKFLNSKIRLSFVSLLIGGILLNAQVPKKIEPFITPFGEFNFTRPEFPENSVSIIDFGAKEGGSILNTEAINNAILKISESGGGKVIIPKGKWLTGPIVLQSNVNLHLEEGAEVLFSQNFKDYLPAVITNIEGSEVYSYSPFIYAFKQENIAITGKGILNGQAKPWWEHRAKLGFSKLTKKLHQMNEDEVTVEERRFDNLNDFLCPVFFGPLYCNNILLEGVQFKYGAFWTINPCFCKNIIIRNVNILTHGEYGHTPNGDGINPSACENVLIEYNTLDTGDDCITIKSGRNKDGRRIGLPCKNILIRHCTGYKGHGGIVIGSEMSGGVENVYAHDCNFNGTDRALRIKTQRGRGAYVKNCWFKDITADSIEREAIRINMLYSGNRLPMQEVNAGTPVVENINYENIQCKYAKRNIIQIVGIPEMPVQNISFKSINLYGKKGIEIIDARNIKLDNISVGNQTGSIASISHSDNINFNNFHVTSIDEKAIPIVFTNVVNSGILNFKSTLTGNLVNIKGNSENVRFDLSIPEDKIKRD